MSKWVLVPRDLVRVHPLPPIPRRVWDAMVERGAENIHGMCRPFEVYGEVPKVRDEMRMVASVALRAALDGQEIADE